MSKHGGTVKLAAVQAAPVFLDLEGSVAKACKLIREAGATGAKVIGFPEGFIPTHPLWYHYIAASSRDAMKFARRLALNSMEIPSRETDLLCQAARDAGAFVVMGLCEKAQGRLGTLYNTLLFINERGEIVGRHRKLVPTLGERLVHTPGDTAGLRAYPTPFGKVGGLMCGENVNPLAAFALDAQGVNIHVASWPAHFDVGGDMHALIQQTTGFLSYQIKAFVINAVGEVNEDMLRELPANEEQRAFLARQGGGSSIIAPYKVLAGPLPPGEAICYADVDIDDLVVPKLVQDFGGHYNRFDLFEVRMSSGIHQNLHQPDRRENALPISSLNPGEQPLQLNESSDPFRRDDG